MFYAHWSRVRPFALDGRFAYVFGRDGGLTKVDLLARRIDKRIIQAGNSIGGSISQDGRLIVAQNYEPGGIKAFDADTLEQLSEVPAEYAPGQFSKVVGLADVSGQRFVYALFEAGEIWVTDFSDPRHPTTTRYPAGGAFDDHAQVAGAAQGLGRGGGTAGEGGQAGEEQGAQAHVSRPPGSPA